MGRSLKARRREVTLGLEMVEYLSDARINALFNLGRNVILPRILSIAANINAPILRGPNAMVDLELATAICVANVCSGAPTDMIARGMGLTQPVVNRVMTRFMLPVAESAAMPFLSVPIDERADVIAYDSPDEPFLGILQIVRRFMQQSTNRQVHASLASHTGGMDEWQQLCLTAPDGLTAVVTRRSRQGVAVAEARQEEVLIPIMIPQELSPGDYWRRAGARLITGGASSCFFLGGILRGLRGDPTPEGIRARLPGMGH